MRREFDVRTADKNGARPGDIVWIEEAGGELSRRARVLERIGPMSDPRTVSLISIAANDIPVDFPEAAAREAAAAEQTAARDQAFARAEQDAAARKEQETRQLGRDALYDRAIEDATARPGVPPARLPSPDSMTAGCAVATKTFQIGNFCRNRVVCQPRSI